MKKMNLVWILAILITFTHCENDPSNDAVVNETQAFDQIFNSSKTIRYNGNYLDFAYYDEFEMIKAFRYNQNARNTVRSEFSNLIAKSPKDLAAELGFTSLQHKYEELVAIQQAYVQDLYNRFKEYSQEELKKLDPNDFPPFAPEIYQHKDILTINEDSGSFELKVQNTELAYLLNEDGVVAIAGAMYQYQGDVVKFMPMNGENTINDLLNSVADVESKGIKVSEVEYQNPDGINKNHTSSCINGATGNGGADHGHYMTAEITHVKYNTYTYEYACAYDSAYYTCWYSTTSGMSYEDKLHICCPRVSVQRRNSEIYAKINSRTSCAFSFFGLCMGDASISVDRLRIRGSFRQNRNGQTYEYLYNESGYNTAYFTYVLYDGVELFNGILAQADFTSFWQNPYTYEDFIYGCPVTLGF
jgi:hypothetical protein